MRNGYGNRMRDGVGMGIKYGTNIGLKRRCVDNKGEFRFRPIRTFVYLFGRSPSYNAKLL